MAETYHFRLFIAGRSPNSALAVTNLRALCAAWLPDRHRIDLVDVLETPGQALDDGVLLTPTLVRVMPKPRRMVVGNLSETQVVLDALDLPRTP
jgi:circadian clock protein KaiB